jgi:two-component system cell cycle response regulator CtrA
MSELQRALDRIEELEGLLGLHINLPNELGLTPLELKYLGLIMRKEIVSQNVIHNAVYGGLPECDQPDPKTIDVHICKIRKKLAPKGLAIKTRYGVGFYMDDETKAALKKLCEIKSSFSPSARGWAA